VSRIAAIVLFAHGILNSLLLVLLPGLEVRLSEMYAAFPGLAISQTSLATAVPSVLIGTIFSGIPIWFLVARRTAFEPQPAGPSGFDPPMPPPLPPAEEAG
jgi:hypothetical protein